MFRWFRIVFYTVCIVTCYHQPQAAGQVIIPNLQMKKLTLEKLSHLPKVTQLISHGVSLQTQVACAHNTVTVRCL